MSHSEVFVLRFGRKCQKFSRKCLTAGLEWAGVAGQDGWLGLDGEPGQDGAGAGQNNEG